MEKDRISEGRAAAWGTLMTFSFRIVSFFCTQATFRLLDPSALGKASIQLELLMTTVLFVSREGFRLALTQNISPGNWNVAWLTVPVVSVVAWVSLAWHLSSETSKNDHDYRLAGSLYCLASWIEGCAEPAVLYFLRQMDVGKRASAEGIATVAKTATTIVCLKYLDSSWHVTAFGSAQIVYALVYAIYLFWQAGSELVPPSAHSFDSSTCYMTFVFTLQGFLKHLLTEADRIILSTVSDNYDQGVYAMGSSYGGMAARILLQPLEESARLLWSRLSNRKEILQLEQSYVLMVKLVSYIGLLFSCVAVNYTNFLISILAGRKWGSNSEAAGVLSAFCIYTAFLAVNGTTEAFVYGVSTSGREIGHLGVVHTLTGVVFAVSSFFLVSKYGTQGLVAANCIAMSIRSMYSISFAAKYFARKKSKSFSSLWFHLVGQIIPHPLVLAGFLFANFATRYSLNRLKEENLHQGINYQSNEWLLLTSQHLAVGVSCALGIAALAITVEVSFFRSLRSMIRPKED